MRTKLFVTTPIFYVNAAPHIGHLYSMVLADVAHRFARFAQMPSISSTGTDEHGMKVEQAAAKNNSAPKPFVDRLSQQFKRLADTSNIDYARFIRTTDSDHIQEASCMWEKLQKDNWIYKAKHTGWYCVSDETFYPETELEIVDGKRISKESRNPVEWYEEENWFFRLSKSQPRSIELYESHPFVSPISRHRSLLNELQSAELQDLSISRPSSRCAWGIPVPADSSSASDQTMYVWFEALINYVTVARSQSPTKSLEDWWPWAAHVVGKDIMRFHAIYWPAFLMAAGLCVPRQVIVHSHWTLEGTKMSKSKNNVVDPFEMIQKYGLDSVRYVLAHDGALAHDSPFSVERSIERHNVNLVNKWANLVSRVTGPKFDLKKSLRTWKKAGFTGGTFEDPFTKEKSPSMSKERCASFAANWEYGRYAQIINDAGMAANVEFQNAEPWTDPESEASQISIALAADTCRIMALLLQPICPTYAANVLDKLGVHSEKRTFEYASFGADLSYGEHISKGHVLQRL